MNCHQALLTHYEYERVLCVQHFVEQGALQEFAQLLALLSHQLCKESRKERIGLWIEIITGITLPLSLTSCKPHHISPHLKVCKISNAGQDMNQRPRLSGNTPGVCGVLESLANNAYQVLPYFLITHATGPFTFSNHMEVDTGNRSVVLCRAFVPNRHSTD